MTFWLSYRWATRHPSRHNSKGYVDIVCETEKGDYRVADYVDPAIAEHIINLHNTYLLDPAHLERDMNTVDSEPPF